MLQATRCCLIGALLLVGALLGRPGCCGEPGPPELIAHWEFESPQEGLVVDSSGNGHHGLLVNMGADALVEGRIGKALRFAGEGEYVRIQGSADHPAFNWNGKSFTIALWTDNAGAAGYLLAQGRGAAQGLGLYEGHFAVGSSAGRSHIANAYFLPEGSRLAFTQGEWHHLAVTYDAPSGLLTTYVDGQIGRVGRPSPADMSDIHRETEDVLLGARAKGIGPYYQGRLDDVRIYAAALSADQVRALYEGRPLSSVPTPEKPDADQPLCVVVMGDSTTLSQRAPAGEKLTDRVQFYLDRQIGTGKTQVVNSGVGSETAAKGFQRIAQVLALKPHVLTVSYGLNDMADSNPEEFRDSLEGIIAAARQNSVPHVILVTSTPFDERRHFFKDWDKFKALGLNQYLDQHFLSVTRQVARQRGLPLCDQFALFMRAFREGQYEITDLIRPEDGVHLTSRGNEVAGKHLAECIVKALQEPATLGQAGEAGPLAAPVALPTPLGHWEFEVVRNSKTPDSSGHGYDGWLWVGAGPQGDRVLSGADWLEPAFWDSRQVEGKIGRALELDKGCYLRLLASATDPAFSFSGKSFTLALWADNPGHAGTLIARADRAGNRGIGIFDGRFCLADSKGHSVAVEFFPGQDRPTRGEWHHLAATCDAASGTLATYLDGRLVGQAGPGEVDMHDLDLPGEDWLFGARFSGRADYRGCLDDVRIYDRALTGEQIRTLYQGGGGPEAE